MEFDELTDEQKTQVMACKTTEELVALIRDCHQEAERPFRRFVEHQLARVRRRHKRDGLQISRQTC